MLEDMKDIEAPIKGEDATMLEERVNIMWKESLNRINMIQYSIHTPWKFNIAREKRWLEDYFPIGKVTFQELC